MPEYYAILGLDPGASPESIKVAYRRLAREYHPDRQVDTNEVERNARSTRMAQLNEAYSTLSDPKRKREYDDSLRTLGMLKNSVVSPPTKPVEKAHSSSGPKPAAGPRARPKHEDDSTVVREFSKQLRANFVAKRDGLSWEEKPQEGFDWGLETTSWSSHYCVASRGFPILDPAAAKKFANYSEFVISQCSRPVRKSHFLFLLPFQQVSEWDTVSHLLQAVISPDNKHGGTSRIVAGIVLVDMRQGRTLRLGTLSKEQPFHRILQSIGSNPG